MEQAHREVPRYRLAMLLGMLSLAHPLYAAEAADDEASTELVEFHTDLMMLPVTSVSKKETKLADSAAAIAVVTAEDIRRLGITSLPEALRLVPGLEVARFGGAHWAISARGSNSEFANKLLVMIDGRTVYLPSSSGVFWQAQDVMIEDIERIEVIRGPGATLWGANAVNGVINIITCDSRATQGGLISTAVGTLEDRPSIAARYGGKRDDRLRYRSYLKYLNRPAFDDVEGKETHDKSHSLRGGFRTDWEAASVDRFTLQGDFYDGEASKPVNHFSLAPPAATLSTAIERNRGADLLGRWTRTLREGSQLGLQAYYDHVRQGDGYGIEAVDTADIEWQHSLGLSRSHDIVWGAGYRHTRVDSESTEDLSWNPERHTIRLFNLFAQDEMTLRPDRWSLILGSKFEHANIVGWQIQPNVRLRWTPAKNQTFWAAASRATRRPSIFELSARIHVAAFPAAPAAPPLLVALLGNPRLDAEKLHAYQAGYRLQPSPRLSFDLTGYFNEYDGLSIVVPGAPVFETAPQPSHVLLPLIYSNAQSGKTYGAELAAQWSATDDLRLAGSCGWIREDLRPQSIVGESPRWQCQARAYMSVSPQLQASIALFHVEDSKSPAGVTVVTIPAWTRLDLGLIWNAAPALQIGVWGQNLLDRRHAEYTSQHSPLPTEIPRGVIGKMTWSF